jgi:hypothetical protein
MISLVTCTTAVQKRLVPSFVTPFLGGKSKIVASNRYSEVPVHRNFIIERLAIRIPNLQSRYTNSALISAK